jgi:hypothetical protein
MATDTAAQIVRKLGRFSRIHGDGVATLFCSVSCTVHALLIAFGLPTTIHGRITNSFFSPFYVFFSYAKAKGSLIRLFGQIFECKTMPNSSSKKPLYNPFWSFGPGKVQCTRRLFLLLLLLLLESASNRK